MVLDHGNAIDGIPGNVLTHGGINIFPFNDLEQITLLLFYQFSYYLIALFVFNGIFFPFGKMKKMDRSIKGYGKFYHLIEHEFAAIQFMKVGCIK